MAQAFMAKRILVVRLDRIGDVILSLPAIRVLRQRLPAAFIALMVRPVCRELVEGHPDLNEVIRYDKDGWHRGAWATVRFAWGLRRYRFDTALVLHPTNRSHWIPWLAGIPRRIGYDRKGGRLLTDRLPHRKPEGTKHEAAYTLELLAPLGIAVGEIPPPSIPVHPEASRAVDQLLAEGPGAGAERLVAIHPSASCISKRWLPERFAAVSDQLIETEGVRVCLVAGPDDVSHAEAVAARMRHPALNLAGRLGLGQLAALLRRCALLISNDSGPVHMAAAVGTPVVALFGRNQRGLSPGRWGPLGEGHVVLHKEVGCVTCLAHECDIEFLCLTSLTVDEVFAAAQRVLRRSDTPHA